MFWIFDYKKVTCTKHVCLFLSSQLVFVLNGCSRIIYVFLPKSNLIFFDWLHSKSNSQKVKTLHDCHTKSSVSIAQTFPLYIFQKNKCLISGEKELCAPGVNSSMILEPFENDYYSHSSFNRLCSFVFISFIATANGFSLSCSI